MVVVMINDHFLKSNLPVLVALCAGQWLGQNCCQKIFTILDVNINCVELLVATIVDIWQGGWWVVQLLRTAQSRGHFRSWTNSVSANAHCSANWPPPPLYYTRQLRPQWRWHNCKVRNWPLWEKLSWQAAGLCNGRVRIVHYSTSLNLNTLEEFNLFVGVEFLNFTEFCLPGFDWPRWRWFWKPQVICGRCCCWFIVAQFPLHRLLDCFALFLAINVPSKLWQLYVNRQWSKTHSLL